MVQSLLIRAAEAGHEGGVNPWVVGVVVLAGLLTLLVALLAFGGGREHS
jgi:hypothetical protein